MDAHFFRALCCELEEYLKGRRVEKIFSPADGVWTFVLQSKGGKEYLLFRPAKSAGLLFISRVKPVNPANPPAQVMWLRKRLAGRRLFEAEHDWINLRIAFTLSPFRQPDKYRYLLLDMKKGVSLVHELPDDFGGSVRWPDLSAIKSEEDIWKDYPQISPPLRRHLSIIPAEEGSSLLLSLENGSPDKFYISAGKKGEPSPPRVWRSGKNPEIFHSAIEAAAVYGEKILFPVMERMENAEQRNLLKSGNRKYRKVLARIEQEEKRLKELLGRKVEAEALQAEMYRIRDMRELDRITVCHPEKGEMEISLGPSMTPTENMERIFRFAAKATRGLKHMERRRSEVEAEHEKFLNSNMMPAESRGGKKKHAVEIPKKYKNIPAAIFVSSDGFLIIRGKNSKANHEILSKVSSVFDYWFHVQDGPGSHVILKRDHPGQDVPEESMREAAALAALKSYRNNDSKADVMCALVKDVRKVKGYAHGQVAVDNVLMNLHVGIDPELEDRLTRQPDRESDD
ncbi:NFACT RNA binding domain-containing protein [Maridesulfovibrio sp.]|uniref:NFACT RNA binding domain-containing protein n=1 Tax=Maridesulfovibrio sp. TaxID=2795000 RepID=UPI002A18BAD6|nr:NFACT RNA binding domain-containing protein [Maridesulfovibrio sp.]